MYILKIINFLNLKLASNRFFIFINDIIDVDLENQ